MSSHIAKVVAQYFAFALDPAMTSCFLLFQDFKMPLIITQTLWFEGEPTQFAYEKTTIQE